MSVYRLAIKTIIETCVGQAAWIWVSGFRKGETEAKLEDFKMFDEASRGCTWPVYPSLAVCGACTESLFSTKCDSENTCSYSMLSGTSITNDEIAPFEYHFTVAPSNGSSAFPNTSSEAIVSIFDIMSSAKTPRDNVVHAYQCALWFCIQSYNVTITNGLVDTSVIGEWSKSDIVPESSDLHAECVFTDIPSEMNAKEHARYSVTLESVKTLRSFMDRLTLGNGSQAAGTLTYDSDWIEAIEAATGNLSGWISQLALSLTREIQLTGTVRSGGKSDYSGTAYIMAPHVEVNWFWVAYPVSLMILAFLYLMQTTDSLPMLFCNVSKTIHAQIGDGMDVPEGLNRRVGRTEVELIRKDNGEWIFAEPRFH
ncbi:hypothetical protein F4808DRAFT_450582 [Astrocystis sublimbata]|nr:hypothetical protein F4808DRAFT_450582 [Astrocystis sublimbata]